MSWKKHFKIVKTVTQGNGVTSPGIVAATSKFSNWLPEVYQGPPNRLQRYVQYDQMDMDHEINAALDTIAEFSTQLDSRTGLPFSIRWKKEPSKSELSVLEKVLMQWCYINEFPKRMFRLFRSTLKYGDQFFIRDPETFKLLWVSQENVEKVIVNESKGKKIEQYYIKNLDLNLTSLVASDTSKTTPAGFHSSGGFKSSPNPGQPNYTTAHNMPTGQGYVAAEQSVPIDAEHVVQVSLTEGMDNAWPFGVSVLEPIFKIYKQKELIEDSVLIYRIHRAPERRVFKIDVGTMPPHKAAQYIERVKYEVQQKRIPSKNGGGASVTDAAYNPMSMLEDYYFAQTSDGRGSDVTTLPGGENMGEIDDLRYFNNKMMRALGVPSSYLPTGPEDGSASYNDGRVGTAFIQEFRFSKTCQRHQNKIVDVFDAEFKKYLKFKGHSGIDTSMFEIVFNEPQNFSKYRQIELDSARINNFTSISDVGFISKRFAVKKYLGLSEEEVKENEKLWAEENNANTAKTSADIRDVGVVPPGAEDFENMSSDLGDFDDDEFADEDIEDVDTDNVGDDNVEGEE